MSDNRRCFMQWFVLLIGYALAGFFAFYYDMLQLIWQTDRTYMTTAIGGVFAATVLYLGITSWRQGTRHVAAVNAGARLGAQVASMVVLMGMLGTVVGLMYQLKAMTGVTADQITPFLSEVGKSLGTAFYCTACGITANIGIKLMVANVDFFIDHDEVLKQKDNPVYPDLVNLGGK